jgi:hypothetical protein
MKIQKLLFIILVLFVQFIYPQSGFELNSNQNSHLYWPFPDSEYVDENNGTNGWHVTNGPGDGYHLGSDLYADDWNLSGIADCDLDFNSPLSGTVIFAGSSTFNTFYGNQVIIQSDSNPDFAFRITHLNTISVSLGDYVAVNEKLGEIGNTGTQYCHAHCALYRNILNGEIGGHKGLWHLKNGDDLGLSGSSENDSIFEAPFYFDVKKCTSFEPNNTYSDATYISTLGKNFDRTETINSCVDFIVVDEDWYSIGAVEQGNLTITLNNPALNVELFDSGIQLLETGIESSNGNKTLTRCFAGNSCNQIFVKISAPPNQSVEPNYALQLDWDYNNGCTASKSDGNFNKITNSDLTIKGDSEICEGGSTSLSVTGGSGNYKWFANSNEIGTGSSITVSNLPQGQNQITVVDLDNPCSSGGSIVVTVNEGITANAGNDATIQDGGNTQLQGSGGSTYSWSPSTGLSNPNISNPVASPSQTTTYTLTVTENGCTDTDSVIITVSQNSTIDIIVDDIWTVPSNPKVGEAVDLYVKFKNTGTEKAYSINLNYIINTNIVGSDNHYALEPNETREEYFNNYTFSSSGTFDFCVDIEAEPNEQNTSNNNYCKQISVGNFTPEDTVVTNISVSSSNLNAGDNLNGSADQYYSGGRTVSELPAIKLGYYLSSDCNFSSDDVLLAEDDSNIGSDTIFESETAVLTIPLSTESGSYFIIFVSDHTNIINESDENNNTLCHHITVSNPNSQIIDAGIVNPVNNLIIHEDNRDTYVLTSDLDKIRVDGWSNTGKISNIQVYKMKGNTPDPDNDTRLYYAENANGGSWWKDADVGPGEHTIYINVICNYNDCLQVGVNSETRKFTYVKPYRAGNFYIPNSSDADVRLVILPNYGSGSLETGFYYRIYRNTSASLSGGTYLGNWTQDGEFIDTNTEPNQTYYYWVDVALNGNGSYNSGITESEYRMVTTQTLGVGDEKLLKSISIFPNPVDENLFINYDNSLIIKEISLFDIKGRLINKIEKSLNKIPTGELSEGIYIISIKTNMGTIVKKIIKE